MATKKKTQRTRKKELQRRGRTAKKSAPLLKFEIFGLILIFFGIFSTISIIGIDTGSVGYSLDGVLAYGFGLGRIVVSLSLIIIGIRYIMLRRLWPFTTTWAWGLWTYELFLTLMHAVAIPSGAEFMPPSLRIGGGLAGAALASILRQLLGQTGTILFLVVAAVATALLWKKWSIAKPVAMATEEVSKMSDKAVEGIQDASTAIRTWQKRHIFDIQKEEGQDVQALPQAEPLQAIPEMIEEREEPEERVPFTPVYVDEEAPDDELQDMDIEPMSEEDFDEWDDVEEEIETEEEDDEFIETEATTATATHSLAAETDVLQSDMADLKPVEVEKTAATADIGAVGTSAVPKAQREQPYRIPPMSMLNPGKPQTGGLSDEVRQNARILQETLQSFNIDAKILNASQGPAVTRYELEPAAGVKVSKIVHLADDIALKLAATDIRIEAPIPGKAAVGIEVPNKKLSGVTIRDVLDTDEFKHTVGGVPVSLGKDIAGNPIIADLTKMPHLLVAGSTGSGKSVCINTFIASILFKQRPEDVKLILIDPKVVELSNYNGIPHLLTPVVTDPKKAASILRWAVREMDDRYKRFAQTKTRDISRYNELHPEDAMAFIVIIIDELADLMMVASSDVEESICRLAQKARACGMHLVLATQRPSVDVLTGLIKANVPSRIAFAVSSQIDSRTILDMAGAEKLIGKGDMLFYPMGASKPIRVQGAFISDAEIDKMTEFIKQQGEPEYDESVERAQSEQQDNEMDFFEDELMSQAIDMVLETGQASASMLQRRFRIGYTRAARMVDTMEAMKIVGPSNGSKAREILMTPEEIQAKYFTGN